MGNVEVTILGQKYVLKGNEPPEYIRQLAALVDEKLREVYAQAPGVTPLKAAILAALTIADEYYKIRNDYDGIAQNIRSIESKADSIIRLFE
jgi:cell division protein ZapA